MFYIAIILVLSFVTGGLVVSRSRFKSKVSQLEYTDTQVVEEKPIATELQRIKQLQDNLKKAKDSADALKIPTPESLNLSDNREETLNKLSRFCEKHSIAQVGTEQVILSLLPSSQIGQAIISFAETLPPNLCLAVFGEAATSIKNSIASIGSEQFLHRLVHGMQHVSQMGMRSVARSLEHHNYFGALLTPIKSGAIEALGIQDASHQTINALQDISENVQSSLELDPSYTELTDITDLDISGHIPVVTIALSSFREIQLLSKNKTSILYSIKNVALDVTGTGVGAAGGAKIGAITGATIGGPVGGIVGGIVGAIAGGIAGRAATNKIKRRPLEKAIDEYKDGFNNMSRETESKSKETLQNIKRITDQKKETFENSALLDNIPVQDTNAAVMATTLVLYQFLLEEFAKLRKYIATVRSSIWYKENEHGVILDRLEARITKLEKELPSINIVKNSPKIALDTLLAMDIPDIFIYDEYQNKVNECGRSLKSVNDKNDASVLMWSYMVNSLYQKTLSEIAEVSNAEMTKLNSLFTDWKKRMTELENQVETEKGRLGI